jgi:transcriptional regulator with XRE-family HTH domain
MDQHIGGRVRERRVERGLTVEQLAAAAGLDAAALGAYENGEVRIPGKDLFAFAKALRYPVQDLFETLRAALRGGI